MKSLIKLLLFVLVLATIGFVAPVNLNTGFETPDWEVVCDQEWSRYGDGVSSGDINGDGYDDVTVGAPAYEPGGAVFIYFGSVSGPSLSADKIIYGNRIGFGNRVSCAGDLNNDSYFDLVIGDPFDTGRIHVYYGSSSGIGDTADWISESPGANVIFGYEVSSNGDVNGDGFDDLVANIRDHYVGQYHVGAYVYLGSASGLSDNGPSWSASTSGASSDEFGWQISISGDVNGDGFDDLALSDIGLTQVSIFYGRANRQMFDSAEVKISMSVSEFGTDAEMIRDVNGDGYDEIAISARLVPGVYVYYGSENGPSNFPDWLHSGSWNCYGYKLSSAGDFNFDGYNDLLVSNCDSPGVFLYFGSQTGLLDSEIPLNSPCYNLTHGDVNGDGKSDAIYSGEPRCYGFFGRSVDCTIHGSEHVTVNSTPVIYWAERIFPGSFELVNYGTNAAILDIFGGDTIAVEVGNYPGYFDLNYRNDTTMLCSKRVYVEEALPVELSTFTSDNHGKNVYLAWSTSSELNNSGFEIQRAIENGKLKMENGEWDKIGFVSGGGTTNEVKEYSFTDRNLETGKYKYRLKQLDFNGNFEYFELAEVVSIGIPDKYDLSQNYPNPFNPVTTINYDLPSDGIVTLKVYDILGREVKTLVNEIKTAGYHKIQFNAADLASGAYFYQMKVGVFVAVKKFVVLK